MSQQSHDGLDVSILFSPSGKDWAASSLLPLMAEILHQLIGSLSLHLPWFYTSQVVGLGISEPSTVPSQPLLWLSTARKLLQDRLFSLCLDDGFSNTLQSSQKVMSFPSC